MEQLASVAMTPYVIGAIMVLIFIVLSTKKLFAPAPEPDPAKLYTPERTGNFKFVEENPEKYVLYAEYERWEVEDMVSFGFKKVYWVRANTEDLNYYYDQQFLARHGRIK